MDMQKLHKVLNGRELWYRTRKSLMVSHPYNSFVELSINVPGWPKREDWIARVFSAGQRYLEQTEYLFIISMAENEAGYFALYGSNLSKKQLKVIAIMIEDREPWGRLLDIDCFDEKRKISREDIGLSPRSCMLCKNPHYFCIGLRTHSLADIRRVAYQRAMLGLSETN